ncbi:MAG: O-antigen ligase family protein [Lachnospiraceae bacterium]|nr:O-antigen ligase family protein [Lachnospiraceae bacterium]
MLTERVKSYFQIIVILFLLGGVYLGYANVWLCVATFLMCLINLNRNEFVLVMLLAGAEYFGTIARMFMGFTVVPQFVVYVVVLVILLPQIASLFRKSIASSVLFILLLSLFAIAFIYGPQHAYSKIKLARILLYGLLCFWTFLIYNREKNIDPQKIAFIFAIVGVTYIVMGVTVYNFGKPSSFFDFTYFGRHVQKFADSFAISYHSVGLAALYGTVFLLSPKEDKQVLNSSSIILLILLIYIALISQMRQGILGIIVLMFVRYGLLIKRKGLVYKLLVFIAIAAILSFALTGVKTAAGQSIADSSNFEQAVNRSYDRGLSIMYEYPFFGVGLGGYSLDGKVTYPHNIFLEIIDELGFVGLFMVLFLSFYAMWCNRFSLKALNANGTFALLFLLAVFIRVNASGDLTENIYFFALLFSIDKNPLNKSLTSYC